MNFSILCLLLAFSGLIALSQASKKISCQICQHNMKLKDNILLESFFGTDGNVTEDANCKSKGGTVKSCDEIIPDGNMCITIEDDKKTYYMRSCVNKEKLIAIKKDLKTDTCEEIKLSDKEFKACTCSTDKCDPEKPSEKSSGSRFMAPTIALLIFFAIKM